MGWVWSTILFSKGEFISVIITTVKLYVLVPSWGYIS